MIAFEGQQYRDDRLYVMRVTSNFIKEADGAVIVESRPQREISDRNPVVLISYRNVQSLPATRIDEFVSYAAAVEYIKQMEPTCPRISLGGKSPNPTPSWTEHLKWLHDQGLYSAAEGELPRPQWDVADNAKEMFFLKK